MTTDLVGVRPAPVLAALAALSALLLALLAPSAAAAPRPKPAPVLSLSPASGPSGTTTTVTGTGFAGRTAATVTLGTDTATATTDRSGRFTAVLTVEGGEGPLPARAVVAGASASAVFTVTAAHRMAFGVSTPGGLRAAAELDDVAATVGEQPGVVLAFSDLGRDVDLEGLRAVAARGAVPLLTLEPWVAGAGTVQPAYALDRIAAGDHDARLQAWGEDLAAHGGRVLLRFAHEMNGDWYPWAAGVNGNTAADYAAAWRHVHAVVTAAGATNVEWVWAPNVPYPGSTPLEQLFPGDDVVDHVGLDGYNWGTSRTWSSWQSPEELFGEALRQVRLLSAHPVVVTETASAELGGDKAQWVRDLVGYLDAQPDVTALVWFDHLKETDWRLDSTAATAAAFREALAARG